MKRLLAILLLSTAALAQDSFTLTAPAPPPPAYVGASYSGQPGPASYYYWVSAVYPGGESGVAGPAAVRGAANTLSGSDTVSVSWSAAFGATSYNVIRTLTPVFSANCSSCLLASGVTGTTTADTGAALSSYSGASAAAPATGGLAVNVRDYAAPRLELRINGQVVASFDASGIASGGGGETPGVTFGGGQTMLVDDDSNTLVIIRGSNPADSTVLEIQDYTGTGNILITAAGRITAVDAFIDDVTAANVLASNVTATNYFVDVDPLGYQHLDGSPPLSFSLKVLADDSAVSTGDGVDSWIVPAEYDGYSLTSVQVDTFSAGATGSMTVQIAKCAAAAGAKCSGTVTDLLSPVATIETGESSSSTATTPPTIVTAGDANILAAGDVLRFDVDSIHSGTAANGLTFLLGFTAP